MIIRQISIFLENKPGQLAGICRALAKAEALAQELKGEVVTNGDIAARCDLIFLCVKPQVAPAVLEEMASCRLEGKVIISIMAGIKSIVLSILRFKRRWNRFIKMLINILLTYIMGS